MSRVFVINEPLRRDIDSGEMTRWMDFTKAMDYGTIVHLLPAGHLPLDPAPTVATLQRKLADFQETDYLIPVGDPTVIGWAIALAARVTQGKVRTLSWIPKQRGYVPTAVVLW